MAKLSVTVTATVTLLLFSFTISHARTPLNLPGNDVINREVQNSLPESDVTPAIHLPNEEASTDGPGVDSNGNSVTVTTMPLKFVKFRPVNRHVFTLRSTLPFRRCRGRRFHHKFRPLGHRVEIPYGNDMIQSSGENSGFDPMSFHGGERQIPPRWITIHDNHHHHHFHHDHFDGDIEIAYSGKLVKKSEETGLFDRFRKFLNQFEF